MVNNFCPWALQWIKTPTEEYSKTCTLKCVCVGGGESFSHPFTIMYVINQKLGFFNSLWTQRINKVRPDEFKQPSTTNRVNAADPVQEMRSVHLARGKRAELSYGTQVTGEKASVQTFRKLCTDFTWFASILWWLTEGFKPSFTAFSHHICPFFSLSVLLLSQTKTLQVTQHLLPSHKARCCLS